jgi:hypothetical protein
MVTHTRTPRRLLLSSFFAFSLFLCLLSCDTMRVVFAMDSVWVGGQDLGASANVVRYDFCM